MLCFIRGFIGSSKSETHHSKLLYELNIQLKRSFEGGENDDNEKSAICAGGIADDNLPTAVKYKKWKWLVVV